MTASSAGPFAVIGPSGSGLGYEHRPPKAPWLMVPENMTRALTLRLEGGQPVTVRNSKDGYVLDHFGGRLCRAYVSGDQLFIRWAGGLPRRDVPIELSNQWRELRVMVSLKRRKTLPIIAHYVEQQPGKWTGMTPARLR